MEETTTQFPIYITCGIDHCTWNENGQTKECRFLNICEHSDFLICNAFGTQLNQDENGVINRCEKCKQAEGK